MLNDFLSLDRQTTSWQLGFVQLLGICREIVFWLCIFPTFSYQCQILSFQLLFFFMMGAPNICYWNYHFVEINNFLISIVNTSFYSWVVICASHVEKALISSLNSLVEKIIKLKVGSCHLWILSFIIDMMEM